MESSMSKLSSALENVYVVFEDNKGLKIVSLTCVGIGTWLTLRKLFDLLQRKYYNLPPGPVGLPFIGAFDDFGNYSKLCNAYKNYGSVHLFYVGNKKICLINDFELMKKYFKQKEWVNRHIASAGYERHIAEVSSDNENWKQRRLYFKNSIIDQLRMETLVSYINNAMVKYIYTIIDNTATNNNNNNGKWLIRRETDYLTFVTVFTSLYGNVVTLPSPNDKLFLKLCDLTDQVFATLILMRTVRLLVGNISWLRKKAMEKIGYANLINERVNVINEWSKIFDNNILKEISDTNITEKELDKKYGHLYYYALKKAVKTSDILRKTTNNYDEMNMITESQAQVDIVASFEAGMRPTSTSIEQSILYLAKNGIKLQNDIFNEISNACDINTDNNNNNNSKTWNDIKEGSKDESDLFVKILKNRQKLPLLSSFIYEILRMHGFTRATFERIFDNDIEIIVDLPKNNNENNKNSKNKKSIKYTIPQNTTIIGNLAGIHHNSMNWNSNSNDDLFCFNPTRFIDPITKQFVGKKKCAMCIFSIGRRNCVGEPLALSELYLVIAMLIKRYIFEIPTNVKSVNDYNIPILFEKNNTPMIGVKVIKRKFN